MVATLRAGAAMATILSRNLRIKNKNLSGFANLSSTYMSSSVNYLRSNAVVFVFVGVFGGIAGMVYRTSAAASNFQKIKETLEVDIFLDSTELSDLMVKNDFKLETFNAITKSLSTVYPSNQTTYTSFVSHVQGYLETPLKLGQLLDRIVLSRQMSQKSIHEDTRFLMTALALCTETDNLEDRAKSLYDMLLATSTSGDVSAQDAALLLEYLFLTFQAPIERKVVKADLTFPAQTYRIATSTELVEAACAEIKAPSSGKLSEEQFVDILLSKVACAWGSCYPRGSN
jgi:hypothetical protein